MTCCGASGNALTTDEAASKVVKIARREMREANETVKLFSILYDRAI